MRAPRCFRPAPLALLLLAAGCGGDPAGPNPDADPVEVFDAAWGAFDRHFAFFAHNQLDWNAVRDRHRPRVTSASSQAELREAICGMVREARSWHAWLIAPQGHCGPAPADWPHHFDPALVRAAVTGLTGTPSGKMGWGRIGDDVGYLHIPSFAGEGWGTEVDGVIEHLGGVRGIVIDIRDNGGGNEDVARQVAARFLDRERVYRISHFRDGPRHSDFAPPRPFRLAPAGRRFAGRVAVLTNRYVGSASEDFLMMMRVIPGVVTVGDTTLGNSSNPRVVDLPNGWTLWVPQSIQTTPEGYIVEGRGLPPTIPVTLDPDEAARGVDSVLRRAVEEVRR